MKQIVLTALSLLIAIASTGQTTIPDTSLERDFANEVKSIAEFVGRFNGDESKPDVASDSLWRSHNIASLFDTKMSHKGLSDEAFLQQIKDFVSSVCDWDGKLTIESNAFAEATCIIKYKGKKYDISVVLKREKTAKGDNKWAVAGLKGMSSLKLYSNKRMAISPVEHEIHFMGMADFFGGNCSRVPHIRSNDKEIDELSFFLGLCIAGAITFVKVDELKMHFVGLPGYVFSIEEITRKGDNSGWLITDMQKADDNAKMEYINNLLGISY